jgi:hypothetical protein
MTTPLSAIAGLQALWGETRGDPRVCIAVLDGPADRAHPALAGAALEDVKTVASGRRGVGVSGGSWRHGTFVASLIFGGPGGPVVGVAPGCRGLIVPIFGDGPNGEPAACSQIDLARALILAATRGAQIINVSGGQFSPSGVAHPILAEAVRACAQRRAIVIAAAGNEGCECLHLPASMPGFLAVGAADARGGPLLLSNWGSAYRRRGLLALGADLIGAQPGGGVTVATGTSYATALVAGVVGLLMSLEFQHGRTPDGPRICDALLATADGCPDDTEHCRRLLAGVLNIPRAMSFLVRRTSSMNDENPIQPSNSPTPGASEAPAAVAASVVETAQPAALVPSAAAGGSCGCGCGNGPARPIVFALGQLRYDLASEARRDSLQQCMGTRADPNNITEFLEYLRTNPWDAAAVIWTLNFHQLPIYAIEPRGAFAREGYERLRQFLAEHHTDEIERISVAGVLAGQATLLNGHVVPVIVPELRGMSSWNTAALARAVAGADDTKKKAAVESFLDRVYHGLHNLGLAPEDRALNFAATNALQAGEVFQSALGAGLELEAIGVERSALCRPDSDCWDVTLTFFDPQQPAHALRRAYRFTVDVSDVVPAMIGRVRAWTVR